MHQWDALDVMPDAGLAPPVAIAEAQEHSFGRYEEMSLRITRDVRLTFFLLFQRLTIFCFSCLSRTRALGGVASLPELYVFVCILIARARTPRSQVTITIDIMRAHASSICQ
jgi:hypothetical protein